MASGPMTTGAAAVTGAGLMGAGGATGNGVSHTKHLRLMAGFHTSQKAHLRRSSWGTETEGADGAYGGGDGCE